ncbi:MAG: hypothetical protein E6J63_16225 [Deltaproteobacteria bacterium]|nr:MAG: hypothetical protein E6J63_16225 [Deltaproteobacteria bacterium]
MTELPSELRHWDRQLSLLPQDLALGLGPLILHLARELGPLGARPLEEGGEPDGYDGLSRRGSYERLASLEWLYALELPDEFLRRAAVGEQSFFHVRLREPAGARRSVALFDAGPAQLGAPRIAQLAALIALARRAEEAGASFEWANLQGDDLYQGVTKASVLHLLHGRSSQEAGQADLLRWRGRVEGAREPDDLWIVGSERLADLNSTESASVLAVRDVIEPGSRQVAVEVRRPASSVRKAWTATILLDLPLPDDCVRLLRDPFRAAVAAPFALAGSIDSRFGIHFAPRGNRLAVRLRSGALLVQPVPGSPREKLAGPRLIPEAAGLALVAIGFRGARCLLAYVEGDWLRIQVQGPRGGLAARLNGRLPSIGERALRPGAMTPGTLYLQRGILIDAEENLFEERSGRWEPSLSRVASSALIHGRVHLIRGPVGEGQATPVAVLDGDRRMRIALHAPFERVLAFQGFGGARGPFGGLAGIRIDASRWAVLGGARGAVEFHPPSGAQVVGVVTEGGEPGLLLLEDGVLSMAGRRFSRVLRLPGRVVMASASPYDPIVASVGDRGQLYVWSLKHRALVLNLQPGGA